MTPETFQGDKKDNITLNENTHTTVDDIQRMLSRQLALDDANVAEMVVVDNRPFCQDVVGTTDSGFPRIVIAGKQ
jgi:hypothetical protein